MSLGLSVTMGLMNFVNLAHGAFAMLGGYACVVAMSRLGVPFLAALPLAFLASALAGAILERLLYRRLYRASHLDQVLFSIGLTFMAVAGATWIFGASQQPVRLPDFLRGQVSIGGADLGIYRLFLVAVVAVLAAALVLLMARTRFGAEVRAAVDDADAARGLGIDVDRVFSVAFALGSGLAGLGGAGTIHGPLAAALLLGVLDVAGKYYVPQAGAFVIYVAMVVLLIAFPRGLFGRRA